MAWLFRRSVNVGPFRMNFSKSGIGYSVGVRGARIGQDARGRKYSQVSIPHTGIYRRDYFEASKQTASAVPLQQSVAGAQRLAQPGIPWRSLLRSPWILYGAGGILLYILIRMIF